MDGGDAPAVRLRAQVADRRPGAVGQPLDHAPARPVRRGDAARDAPYPDQGHAAAARLWRRRLTHDYALAHVLIGEPAAIPDQVRDRLSPDHALGTRNAHRRHPRARGPAALAAQELE